MLKSIAFILAAACALPVSASAQMLVGYDALGRVICVKHQNGKLTAYAYDPAGNRLSKTVASGSTCVSQTVAAPPAQPVDITANNPAVTVASQSTTTYPAASLGSASDSAILTLVSASTSGGVCGSASTTSSALTYVAPPVTPQNATRTCHVDYLLRHPGGLQDGGRITVTVTGTG